MSFLLANSPLRWRAMLAASARACRVLASAAAIAAAAGCAQPSPQRAAATLAIVGATVVHPESDLAILDADPTADVANVSRIWRVVKDGQVYDPDALIASIR